MINTSTEYQQGMDQKRRFIARASCLLKNGTVLDFDTTNLMAGGIKIADGVSGTSKFEVGTAIINQLTIMVFNGEEMFSDYDFTDAVITVWVGMPLTDRTEWIKKGVFNATDPTTTPGVITLKALDNMSKFDQAYDGGIGFPATLQSIMQYCCTRCGVLLLNGEFPNYRYQVFKNPFGDTTNITYRAIIAYCALLAGCYARCNVDGRLEFRWYDTAAFDGIIDGGIFDETTEASYQTGANLDGGNFTDYNSGDNADGGTFTDVLPYHHIYSFSSLSVSTEDVVITGIRVTAADGEDDTGKKIEGETYLCGAEGYVLDVSGNPLIEAGKAKAVAEYLAGRVVGMQFRPFQASSIGDPSWEAGDAAVVTDRKGNSYYTYLTNITYSTGGYASISCDAEPAARHSADRYAEINRIVADIKRDSQQKLTEYAQHIDQMNSLAINAMGYYETQEIQDDGSAITYMHDKPILAESKIVYKKSIDGYFWSKDGGKTWTGGVDKDGNAVMNVIAAIGIRGDWVDAGSITSNKLSSEYKHSVEKYSEDKAASALDNAKKYTEAKLELYSTTEEVRTAIKQSADGIRIEAEQKYTTTMQVTQAVDKAKDAAIQAGQDAADKAEFNANESTDEKLKSYSTTEQMKSAIDLSAEGIELSASKTYTTFTDVNTTADNVKKEAIEAGQEAANKAESNAIKAGEDAAAQALMEAKSAITLAADEISASVKKLEQETKHNYVTNGDFADGLTNWTVSDADVVSLVNDEKLGRCVKFTGSSTKAYLRYTIYNIKAGRYKVRFKAAGEEGARIRCQFSGTQYTAPGEMSTVWSPFEFDFVTPTDNSWYVYFYNAASGVSVCIKDIEILGGYEQYNEARITVMSDKIESRVSKDEISSYVTQYYDRVITAFNDSSKYVQISAGEIAIYDGAVSSSKKRSAFNSSGNHFWRDGYYVGKIGTNELTENTSYKGLSFDLEPNGKYMSWGYRKNPSDSFYTSMLIFFPQANIGNNPYAGLHLGHDLYTYGHTISLDLKGRTWTKGYSNGAAIRTNDIFRIEDGTGNGIAQFDSSKVVIAKNLYANLVGTPSDERLKDNIMDSTVDALQTIMAMQMHSFDWIENGEHESIGLIAQEVEAIAPDLVSESSGIKHINSTRLLWYCVRAIQQIQKIPTTNTLMMSAEKMTLEEKKAWIAEMKENQKPVEAEPNVITIPIQ